MQCLARGAIVNTATYIHSMMICEHFGGSLYFYAYNVCMYSSDDESWYGKSTDITEIDRFICSICENYKRSCKYVYKKLKEKFYISIFTI